MGTRGWFWFVLGLALTMSACSPKALFYEPSTPREYFDRYVVPELSWRCIADGCHATPVSDYRARGPGWFKLAVDADGRIGSPEALDIAYQEATGALEIPVLSGESVETHQLKLESARRRLDRASPAIFSDLVRKPLPVALGGLTHRGGDNYVSLEDPGLVRLMEWIELERSPKQEAPPPLVAQFARDVQPVLLRQGCAVTACHGPHVGNPLKLEPGISGELSQMMTDHNYKVARAFINVNSSTAAQSRLLAKALTPDEGGIAHRGSNLFLLPQGSADRRAVEGWIREERRVAGLADQALRVVFVDRPPSPRAYFDVGAWSPGARLRELAVDEPGSIRDLDVGVGSDLVDIRTPEVSPDGRTIVFALRRSAEDCLNLYDMPLAGGAPRALTQDRGCRLESFSEEHSNPANLSPRYAPDGRIYFVSTRAGGMADRGSAPVTHIWSIPTEGGEPRQETFSPGHEVDLSLGTKSGKAILVFTSLKDISSARHGAVYFFPPGWWMDYHPMFGEQSRYPLFTQASELPDLRTVVTLQGWNGRLQAGALAIFDRNMGPDLEDPADLARASIPGFLRALTVLSDERAVFEDGPSLLYRNPVSLPDGRLIVGRSDRPVDVGSATAAVDFELIVQALETRASDRMPALGPSQRLYAAEGRWAVEPAVVYPRRLPAVGKSYLRGDLPATEGEIQFYDAYTLESILRDNRPVGRTAMIRPDLSALRVVFGDAASPRDAAHLAPERVRNGDPASTRVSNGIHGRRWASEPIPIERDGSVYFRLPSLRSFYLQALNPQGMSVGMQYDRWLFLNEREAFGNGVATRTFDAVCGGCHGSLSGEPAEAFGNVDVVSSPSVTLATHEGPETRRAPRPVPEIDSISFRRELGPLLEARCGTSVCHAAPTPAGGLDLSATTPYAGPWSNAYESLMRLGDGSGAPGPGQKEYVDERDARAARSFLVELLRQEELEAPRGLRPGNCAAAQVLNATEKARVVLWIELGATFLDPEDP